MSAIGKWTLGKLRRFICIVVNSDCPAETPDAGTFDTIHVSPGPSDFNGDVVAGSTCADEFYLSSSLTASCDTLILNDKRVFFGDASGIKPDPDGGAIYHDTGVSYRRLVVSSSADTSFLGGIYGHHIESGALAGPGSYIGVNGDSLLVLTSAQDTTPDLSGDNIAGTNCTNYFYLSSSLTAACATYLSGVVGIGVPGGFDSDLSLTPRLKISNADDNTSAGTVVDIEQHSDEIDGSDLFFYKTRGTNASPTDVEGNDQIGLIRFFGRFGGTRSEVARFEVGVDQASGQAATFGDAPGFFQIATTPSGTGAPRRRFIIAENGNVGIGPNWGTGGPYKDEIHAQLHVSGSVIMGTDCDDFVHISGSLTASCCEHKFLGPVIMEEGAGSACTPPKFYFTKSNPGVTHEISLSGSWLSASTGITHVSGGITQYAASAAYTTISTSGSLTTGSDGIVIIKPGKIGIGTDNPATALQVAGTIRAQEISIVGGAITGSRAIFTETLNVTGAITTAAAIVATGSVRAAGDLYTNQIRRNSSNSTTTKINLDASAQKFFVGHSSNEMIKITSAGLFVKGAMSGSSTLKTAGAITTAGALNVTGTITAAGIASGTIAGPGSYVGLNANNQLVLTASAAGGSTSPGGSDTQIQYNNGSSFGGVASLTYNDGTGHLNVIDDKKLYFGTGDDASIEYDENGTDRLIISGPASGIDITGSIFATGIASGSIAGPGSYVGLNASNQLVLTASAGGGGTDTNEFVITCQGFTYSHTSNTYFRTLPGSAGGIGYWTTAEAGQTTNAGDTLTIDYQLAGPSGATFIAPAACTITELRGYIKCGSGADILTARLYKATGTDDTTGTSDSMTATQINAGAAISAATNGKCFTLAETISSDNALAAGESLILAFTANGSSTQKNYFTITIRGVWS